MIPIDTVLVKLASRCNLACDYCYVYQMGDEAWRLQPKRMAEATAEALAGQLARLVERQGRPLSVVFHGGEPLVCYEISKKDFEAKLGNMPKLQAEMFAADPRKLISDFYMKGDHMGPLGVHKANKTKPNGPETSWFAVYRPCSRDSIAKMLGTVGVGKGLNIKGKSAKKNRLSGFVPFLQISDNDHKEMVEESPRDARTKIYYKNVMAREIANATMGKVLRECGTHVLASRTAVPMVGALSPRTPRPLPPQPP